MPSTAHVIATATLLLGGSAALAGDAQLDDDRLAQHCTRFVADPADPAGQACLAYIQGFLDGSLVTDNAVYEQLGAGDAGPDGAFTDRATRTRLGPMGGTGNRRRFSGFCIPPDTPLPQVVSTVANALEQEAAAADSDAAAVVGAVLRTHYPCPMP